MYQQVDISSTIMKRRKNSFKLRLNSNKYCCQVVSRLCLLSGLSKRGTRQLSHAQYFLFDMSHAVIWDLHCLSCHAHLQSAVSDMKTWTFVTLSSVHLGETHYFFYFSKIYGHDRFNMWSKGNYKSDSTYFDCSRLRECLRALIVSSCMGR